MKLETETGPHSSPTGAPNAGQVSARSFKHMSGLEFLQAMIDGELPPPPIAELLDFRLAEAEVGRAVFIGHPAPQHYNPIGTVHGGYAATLLDSAMACAVHTTLEPGMAYTTMELKVNFVRAITRETGPLRVVGKLIYNGSRAATSEGRLTDEAGKLYAHGSTTCMKFPM